MSDTEPRDETFLEEPEEVAQTTEPAPAGRMHGWVSLYLLAFVLLLASGLSVALAARSFLQSLAPLYLSIGLSVVAAILAVIAVVLPKRGG